MTAPWAMAAEIFCINSLNTAVFICLLYWLHVGFITECQMDLLNWTFMDWITYNLSQCFILIWLISVCMCLLCGCEETQALGESQSLCFNKGLSLSIWQSLESSMTGRLISPSGWWGESCLWNALLEHLNAVCWVNSTWTWSGFSSLIFFFVWVYCYVKMY